MNKDEVIELLKANSDVRGIKHWEKSGDKRWLSFGIGLTKLKTLAKKIPKNHILSRELWNTDIYEAKVLSILIEDPKLVTVEQVEQQIPTLHFWMLSNIYCSMLLPRLKFVNSLAEQWRKNPDPIIRRCGYLALYENSKSEKSHSDEYYLDILNDIEVNIQTEENFVKDAMNNVLWKIGMRNSILNKKAKEIAMKIGEVIVDYGDNSCKAINCSEYLAKFKG